MPRKTFARLLLVCTLAFPAFAQTAAEQLQKGIFAQDTQGKLDDAIAIYRQIASSTASPRDTAAQAQYRLAQALLQKGDIPNATRAFEQLERAFPESGQLISQLASRLHSTPAGSVNVAVPEPVILQQITQVRKAIEAGGPIAGAAIKEYGRVTQLQFVNPSSTISVTTATTNYIFILSSPNSMFRQGFARDTIKAGDMVTINGILPDVTKDNGVGVANTIELASNGQVVFDRAKLLPAPTATASAPAPTPVARVVAMTLQPSPEVTVKVLPQYTEEARKALYQGQITVAAQVNEQGLPTNLRVVKPLGLGLDENALTAVKQWKFAITMKDGKPVPAQALIQINYILEPFYFTGFATAVPTTPR